jgi:hypothetical protein
MMNRRGFLPRMLAMLAGLLAWALHFALLYGFGALVCAGRIGAEGPFGLPAIPLFTAVATLGLAAPVALAVVRARKVGGGRDEPDPAEHFMAELTVLTGALALLAMAWTGLAGFVTPHCLPT